MRAWALFACKLHSKYREFIVLKSYRLMAPHSSSCTSPEIFQNNELMPTSSLNFHPGSSQMYWWVVAALKAAPAKLLIDHDELPPCGGGEFISWTVQNCKRVGVWMLQPFTRLVAFYTDLSDKWFWICFNSISSLGQALDRLAGRKRGDSRGEV